MKSPLLIIPGVRAMGCWKWFDRIVKEAGVKVTDENREKIHEVIHEFVGEDASYGSCSVGWGKEGRKIKIDEEERKRLIERLREVVS